MLKSPRSLVLKTASTSFAAWLMSVAIHDTLVLFFADKLKKDRKNKKNCKSSNDCENLLENGRAMQLEACQPFEDDGAFSKGIKNMNGV